MAASAGVWGPIVAGAVGGFLQGGGPGEGSQGWPSEFRGLNRQSADDAKDPLAMSLMREGLGDLRRLGAKTAQYMTRPVVLPSAVVQPLPMFKGGGAFVDVGAPTMDPAFLSPELLYRPGVDWGTPDANNTLAVEPTPFYKGAGKTVHMRSPPPMLLPQQYPQFGAGYAGIKEMSQALALVGIPESEQTPRAGGPKGAIGGGAFKDQSRAGKIAFSGARWNLPHR